MDKKDIIRQLASTRYQLMHSLIPYAMDSWRKLDVPLAQLKSLYIIVSRGHTNFRNLAKDLGVTPGNVTGIIDRLVEQGLVVRNPSPEDHRVVRLQATDRGRALVADLVENHVRHMVRALERMSMEDLEALLHGLSGLNQAVQEDNHTTSNASE